MILRSDVMCFVLVFWLVEAAMSHAAPIGSQEDFLAAGQDEAMLLRQPHTRRPFRVDAAGALRAMVHASHFKQRANRKTCHNPVTLCRYEFDFGQLAVHAWPRDAPKAALFGACRGWVLKSARWGWHSQTRATLRSHPGWNGKSRGVSLSRLAIDRCQQR